jgi:ribosome-associated protein
LAHVTKRTAPPKKKTTVSKPEPKAKATKKPSRPRRAAAPASSAVDEARRESLEAAHAAIDAALDKKALAPVLIDVTGRTSYTDFIGIVSARSDRQVDAIAESVRMAMQQRGHRLLGRESGRWTLLHFDDIVVHVFYHPVRELFDIESLWIDAPRVKLDIPPEARLDAAAPPA